MVVDKGAKPEKEQVKEVRQQADRLVKLALQRKK
jgi:hypothetical protein